MTNFYKANHYNVGDLLAVLQNIPKGASKGFNLLFFFIQESNKYLTISVNDCESPDWANCTNSTVFWGECLCIMTNKKIPKMLDK